MDDAFRTAVASRVGYDLDTINVPTDPGYLLLDNNFDVVTHAELEAYPWNWNTQDVVYVPVTPPTASTGRDNYQGIITLDDSVARVLGVFQEGQPIRYERTGKELLLWNYYEGVDMIVRCQLYCDVKIWPQLFKDVIIWRLAAMMAGSLMQRINVADWMNQRADIQLIQLKSWDSQQQTVDRIQTHRYATARRTPYTGPGRPRGNQHG